MRDPRWQMPALQFVVDFRYDGSRATAEDSKVVRFIFIETCRQQCGNYNDIPPRYEEKKDVQVDVWDAIRKSPRRRSEQGMVQGRARKGRGQRPCGYDRRYWPPANRHLREAPARRALAGLGYSSCVEVSKVEDLLFGPRPRA